MLHRQMKQRQAGKKSNGKEGKVNGVSLSGTAGINSVQLTFGFNSSHKWPQTSPTQDFSKTIFLVVSLEEK